MYHADGVKTAHRLCYSGVTPCVRERDHKARGALPVFTRAPPFRWWGRTLAMKTKAGFIPAICREGDAGSIPALCTMCSTCLEPPFNGAGCFSRAPDQPVRMSLPAAHPGTGHGSLPAAYECPRLRGQRRAVSLAVNGVRDAPTAFFMAIGQQHAPCRSHICFMRLSGRWAGLWRHRRRPIRRLCLLRSKEA